MQSLCKSDYWHWGIGLALAAFLVLVYPHTQWDTQLIAPYYDASARLFPLKNHWLFDTVLHQGLKTALLILPITTVLLLLWSWRDPRLTPQRRRLAWLALAQILAPLVVATLKYQSVHACPWDLSQYGGYAPYLALFDHLPAGVELGRCLPGGHASAGYALLAFYFGLRDGFRKYAQWALAAGLLMGTLMGWAQMIRGAHFLSHNLWTLWVVWMVLLVCYRVWPPVVEARHA